MNNSDNNHPQEEEEQNVGFMPIAAYGCSPIPGVFLEFSIQEGFTAEDVAPFLAEIFRVGDLTSATVLSVARELPFYVFYESFETVNASGIVPPDIVAAQHVAHGSGGKLVLKMHYGHRMSFLSPSPSGFHKEASFRFSLASSCDKKKALDFYKSVYPGRDTSYLPLLRDPPVFSFINDLDAWKKATDMGLPLQLSVSYRNRK